MTDQSFNNSSRYSVLAPAIATNSLTMSKPGLKPIAPNVNVTPGSTESESSYPAKGNGEELSERDPVANDLGPDVPTLTDVMDGGDVPALFAYWKALGCPELDLFQGETTQLNENDVLCGSGGGTNKHVGNKRLKKVVSIVLPMYFSFHGKALTKEIKDAKKEILSFVLYLIRGDGTRFLRETLKSRMSIAAYSATYEEIGDDTAIKKIQYAFKDSPRRKPTSAAVEEALSPAPAPRQLPSTHSSCYHTRPSVLRLPAIGTPSIATAPTSSHLSKADLACLPPPEHDGALALLTLCAPMPRFNEAASSPSTQSSSKFSPTEPKKGILSKLKNRQRNRQKQQEQQQLSSHVDKAPTAVPNHQRSSAIICDNRLSASVLKQTPSTASPILEHPDTICSSHHRIQSVPSTSQIMTCSRCHQVKGMLKFRTKHWQQGATSNLKMEVPCRLCEDTKSP